MSSGNEQKAQTKSSGNISRNQYKSQMNGLSHVEKLGIMEALDHLFVARQYKEIGSCTVCKKICEKNFLDCGTYYCSVQCQNIDWPKHKAICMKSQSSGSFNKVSSSALINTTSACGEDNMCESDSFGVNNYKSPFKALLNQMNKKAGTSVDEIHLPRNSCRLPTETKSDFSNKPKMLSNSSKKFSINKEMIRNLIVTQMEQVPSPRQLFPNEQKVRDEDKDWGSPLRSDNAMGDPVSSTKAKSMATGIREVTCTFRETDNRYWVMDVGNATNYAEIQTTLAKECDGYDSVDPQEGLVCGVSFADEWYRGKVVSVSPKTSVHFIDYGNTSDYEFDFVKKLPEGLKSLPGLAFLIEFEQGSPNEYKSANLDSLSLTVEETRKTSDGVSCVKIITGCFGPTAEGSPKQKVRHASVRERSVLETLEKDTKGMIFFIPGGSKTRFGSVLPDNNENAKQCLENILTFDSSKSSPIEGKEGDYVLVMDKEGNDQRGKIISKVDSTYYVFCTDCGNVLDTDVVFPMPAEAKDLIELGATVTMQESFSEEWELEGLDAVYFHITGEQASGKWPCELKKASDKQLVAKGFIEKPTATLEVNPNHLHLKSGCTVEISALSSENSFYVRAIGTALETELLKLNNEMRDYAAKADSLTCPPEPGHLCCVRFLEDDCFYRAEVLSQVNSQKVMVLFVDFGNEQETDWRDIKPLPEALTKIPFFAVKVTLSKVPSKPRTQSVNDYIKKLVVEGAELVLTYIKSIREGVTLKEKRTGVIVNDFINGAIEKEKTENLAPAEPALVPAKDQDIITYEDMKRTTLTLDSHCDLFLLYINESEFCTKGSFWATDAGSKNMVHVLRDLTVQISAHCAASQMPYHPAVCEICLAEFEGDWYRALTVETRGDVFTVFFLDFGNTCVLKSKSIRKMEREFIKAPVLAVNCALKDHQRSVANPETAKKLLNILEERVNSPLNNVHVTGRDGDTFFVTILEIQDILPES